MFMLPHIVCHHLIFLWLRHYVSIIIRKHAGQKSGTTVFIIADRIIFSIDKWIGADIGYGSIGCMDECHDNIFFL